MTKDELILGIDKGLELSVLNRDSVLEILCFGTFSENECQLVQNWLGIQNYNEIKYLLNNLSLTEELTESIQKIDEKTFEDIFRDIPLPVKLKNKLKNNILFSKLTLRSGISFSVDKKGFFKTLCEGVKKHPSLVDDLRRVALYAEQMVVEPNKVFHLNGGYIYNKKRLLIDCLMPSEKDLSIIIHELGHSENSRFVKKYKDSYLTSIIDEMEQNAKSEIYDEKEKKIILKIKNYLSESLKKKHPSLSKIQLERATVIHLKRELVLLSLLPKEVLGSVMANLRKRGIFASSQDQNNIYSESDFINSILNRQEFYASHYCYYEGKDILKANLKNKMLKKYRSSLLLADYFKKQGKEPLLDVLSDRFCSEMLGYTGFIPTQKTHLLRLNRIYFEPLKEQPAWLPEYEKWGAVIDCRGLTPQEISETQRFYKEQGVLFTHEDENTLLLQNPAHLKKLSKIICTDYNEGQVPFLLTEEREGKNVYFQNINFLNVENLEQRVQKFMTRWEHKGFKLSATKCAPTDFRFELPAEKIDVFNRYKKTVEFARNVIYNLPLSYEYERQSQKSAVANKKKPFFIRLVKGLKR